MDGNKKITAVNDPESIDIVARLGDEIWREHYVPIIGEAQVNYMLDKFQSPRAIASQIKEGASYYLVYMNEKAVGYFSFYEKDKGLFLSKIYIHSSLRGSGLGRFSIDFIEREAEQKKLSHIELTVNKNNEKTIAAYKKMGFQIEEAIVMDIGNGFVMDDYRMIKKIL